MEYSKLQGQRGSKILVKDGFLYNIHSECGIYERWRCQNRKCQAYLLLSNEKIQLMNNHNHERQDAKIEKLKLLENIKNRSCKTRENASTILVEETKKIKNNDLNIPIKIESLKRAIKRERNKKKMFDVEEFSDIPEFLKYDHQDNLFLIYDSGYLDNKRFVVFSSFFKKQYIEKAKVFLIDGTFRTSPNKFYQLLTIHFQFLGKFFPAYYILCKNKKQESYCYIFQYLRDFLNFNPETVITDFEISLFNGLKLVYPQLNQYFCYFHYIQSLSRRLNKLKLKDLYKNDTEFKKVIKNIYILPLLPVKRVYSFFLEFEKLLLSFANVEIKKFVTYLKENYIGFFEEQVSKNAKYDIQNWSCFDRIQKNIPRTTNIAEAWHRAFNQTCVISHPNISTFILALKDNEELNRIEICQALRGKISLPRKKLKREELLRSILNSAEMLDDFAILEILRSLY